MGLTMTAIEVSAAVAYNRGQPFTDNEVKGIQRVVGANPDGIWGPITVRAVYDWQTAKGIPPDGKVWKSPRGNTWPSLKSLLPSPPQVAGYRVGIWIDDAPQMVRTTAYVESLSELGIDTVAIMVNQANTTSSAPAWSMLWSAAELLDAAQRFRNAGIDVVLTAWPRPSKQQIDQLCSALQPLLNDSGAVGFEVDTEGNWAESFLADFDSLKSAGAYLAERMRATAPAGTRLELTTYPYHAEFTSGATVSPFMDVLLPQAYSVSRAGGPGFDDRLGPGGMQQTAIERASRIQGPRLACGLAAYYQEYPGHTANEAMQRALDVVGEHQVQEIRYWSSKWVIGHQKNDYAAGFVRSIAKLGQGRV